MKKKNLVLDDAAKAAEDAKNAAAVLELTLTTRTGLEEACDEEGRELVKKLAGVHIFI